jgi:hypothetical protein
MIETVIEHCGAQSWFGTAVDIHHGRRVRRVPEDATAYPSRAGQFLLNVYGFWSDPADDPARIGWVWVLDAMRPHAIEAST